MTTFFDPIDNYEFCHQTLRYFGYKGNILQREEVGKFLTNYLVEQGYKTRRNEYARIFSIPVLASDKTGHYMRSLMWLLQVIIAANSMTLSIPTNTKFPSCEM
ncbi:hypothetical protein [Nostoc sp.]|uniref:hypothetical protein n=1 Tax=Nostoc sp. TaxID=1180 RepID=UPI002FF7B7FC